MPDESCKIIYEAQYGTPNLVEKVLMEANLFDYTNMNKIID